MCIFKSLMICLGINLTMNYEEEDFLTFCNYGMPQYILLIERLPYKLIQGVCVCVRQRDI